MDPKDIHAQASSYDKTRKGGEATMLRNPNSRGSCYWHFIAVVAVALGAVGCRAAASGKKNTGPSSWTVCIKPGSGSNLTFSDPVSSGNCPPPSPSATGDLNVSQNDQVTWTVVNGSSDPIVVFASGKIFVSSPGSSSDVLDGDGTITTRLTYPSGASSFNGGYYVAVLHKGTWYTADPKILIGGGNSISAVLRELQQLKTANAKQASAIKELICRVEELEKQLKSK
ncbi:MAG: hypothetical protein ACRD3T_05990 [Terriglobia bacterium]